MMPGRDLRLLALDGGGVRGLSALMILQQLMKTIDPENPPKPCDYFDMIGGTSTGGLIAVMLGRLKMSIDDCIDAYLSLSDRVFQKKRHRLTVKGNIQGRFDSEELARAVKEVLTAQNLKEDTLLKDVSDDACKVFVCATSKETSETVCLTSYKSPRSGSDLLNSVQIWEACRATSAASTFFDPIAIGRYKEEFADGATGANNPVWEVWNQAQLMWGPQPLENKIKCLVSIGTGIRSLVPFLDDVFNIDKTLVSIAIETEQTAERFRRDKSHLEDSGQYYRFNVDRGLEEVGLEESKKRKEIAAATRRYIGSHGVLKQMQACANSIVRRELLTVEEQKYLQDFATFDYEAYLRQAPTKFPGTLQWFDQHETYRAWVDATSSQMLMIYGPPGCGKTVIARSLIDNLQSLSESRHRPNFFLCNAASPGQRTAQGILTGLVNQCLAWHPSLAFNIARPYFRPQYNSETLLELFEALVNAGICRFVLLDGLDECDDQSQIFILENFQQRLLPCTLSRFPFKVIVTCRQTFAIKKAISWHPLCLEIVLDQCHENISSDLSLVIDDKVSKFTEFYGIGSQLREDITRSLNDKADGNFLWATLADDLMNCESTITPDGIGLLLNSIPTGLTGIYNKILESINSRRYQDAIMALKWIVLAVRPMKVDELSLALALGSTPREVKDVTSFQFLNVGLELLKILGPLVKIVNNEVFLVHKSAKDFLLGYTFESNKGKAEPFIQVVPQRDHALLAQVCLRYLSECGFEKPIEPMAQQFDEEDRNLNKNEEQTLTSEPPGDDHPIYAAVDWLRRRNAQLRFVLEEFLFLEYAGGNWAFHAKRQDLVLDYKPFSWLFEKPSTIFQQWKYLNDLKGGLILGACLSLGLSETGISHIESQVIRGEASPIHIATYFGLKDLAMSIFAESGADLESVIAVASDGGQGAIVKHFLAQAAPWHSLGRATLRASSMGHEDVVSLLLDHGAKADDGILAAAFNGCDKVTLLLLERGARHLSHLALLAACIGGHSSSVEIVLENRNDLPIFSKDLVSSMKQAYDFSIGTTEASAQYLEFMETIEEIVAEFEGIVADYWSPLLISSMLGHSKVVEFLLNRGHINDEKPGGWTVALLIATLFGLGSIVDVLLNCWKDGADLEVSVIYGCATEHNLLIRTILEKMHARGYPFLRKPQALERALKAGNEEMRRMIEAYPDRLK